MTDQEKSLQLVKLYRQFTDSLKAHNIKPRGAITIFIAFAAQTYQSQSEVGRCQSESFKAVADLAMVLHDKAVQAERENSDPSQN